MPRKPRLHVPGGFYHVILRGNSRQAIFFDKADRALWESLITGRLIRYGHRLHAYCWMTNHVHMALQCSDIPVSHFIRDVASQYARSTNKKMGRSGHLFERRHRLILVQADSYLETLVRYIHQNPTRAGMVEDLSSYPWSSLGAYLGGDKPKWLTIDLVLSMFGKTQKVAIKHFRSFMQSAVNEADSQLLVQGCESDDRILGDDQFIDIATKASCTNVVTETLDDIVQRICTAEQCSEMELTSKSRNRRNAEIRAQIALAATEAGVATLATVARRFDRSESVLSRSMSRLRAKRQ